MLQQDEMYMQRCLQLAKQGVGYVAPNPMVGAVLVYEARIIGEGYHKKYGEAHAEVNCIASVKEDDKLLIEKSILYVSLEPCAHYGKTPPCSDLIIRNKIPKVIIGCRDPFKEVNGKGIEKLLSAGADVVTGILEKDCKELNKRFFTFHTKKRPYIILKWAQTADKKIAAYGNERLIISNILTNRLVHKWRSEEAAILVGTNTAIADDPVLTNRLWSGKNPVRLVIDKDLKVPANANIYNEEAATIVFNFHKTTIDTRSALINKTYFYKIDGNKTLINQIMEACYTLNIQSVLVEGGAKLLQLFLNEKLHDEIRVITNETMVINDGLNAPVFNGINKLHSEFIETDRIEVFR